MISRPPPPMLSSSATPTLETIARHPGGLRRAMALLLLCAAAAPLRAEPLDELRALVEAGRSEEAYATYCADPDVTTRPRGFDLWCGVAAVDLGRAGEGVLSIERYVLQFPDDLRGRLELARAYFQAGDNVRAREEFEAVAKAGPPPEVQIGIDRYLAALEAREGRYRTRTSALVEVGAGYDSNANAGVSQANIGLPVLGPVTVDQIGVRTASAFAWLAAAGRIDHPFAPGWSLNGSAYANGMYYADASEFNLGQFGAALGVTRTAAANVYSLSYAHGEIQLDGSRYRWTDGVGFEWRRQLSEQSSFALIPQYARLSYSGENSARNADLLALSAAYRRMWLKPWHPVLNALVFYGDEHNIENRDDLGRHVFGGAADVTVSPSAFWAFNAGIGYIESRYQAPIPLIEVERRDRNLTLNLSALYLMDSHWSLRAEYQYAHNGSNLELYDYSRHVGALKLRYDFR
jgi:surface lipoprotein assembly modifier-like protein